MKFEKKISTDPSDIDKIAEMELTRLVRQYRLMEGDKTAFSEDSNRKLRKQERLIKDLEQERDNLDVELKLITSEQNKQKDEATNKKMEQLLKQQQAYVGDIKTLKSNIDDIKFQIHKVDREIKILKRKDVSDIVANDQVVRASKRIVTFENRLEVATKRFNQTVAENDRLREEINHLLLERAHFNDLWNTLLNKLNKQKKYLFDVIEQATLAFDQREEWCNKLHSLKTRGRIDLMIHMQEMRDLQRRRDHDAKLQEFLGVKGQRRVMDDLAEREARKRQQEKEDVEKELVHYKELLQQIQEYANEHDINRLSKQFMKQEEENFALFNYVNELNQEIESLNDSVDALKQNIAEQKVLNDKNAKEQKEHLEQLQAELKRQTEEAETAEAEFEECQKNLTETMQAIEKIFKMVECDNSPLLHLLGDNSTVNVYNVGLYLKILEKRTHELISVAYAKDKKDDESTRPETRKSSGIDSGVRDLTPIDQNNNQSKILEL